MSELSVRVGVVDTPFGFPVSKAVRAVVDDALADLRRGLRARWKPAAMR